MEGFEPTGWIRFRKLCCEDFGPSRQSLCFAEFTTIILSVAIVCTRTAPLCLPHHHPFHPDGAHQFSGRLRRAVCKSVCPSIVSLSSRPSPHVKGEHPQFTLSVHLTLMRPHLVFCQSCQVVNRALLPTFTYPRVQRRDLRLNVKSRVGQDFIRRLLFCLCRTLPRHPWFCRPVHALATVPYTCFYYPSAKPLSPIRADGVEPSVQEGHSLPGV